MVTIQRNRWEHKKARNVAVQGALGSVVQPFSLELRSMTGAERPKMTCPEELHRMKGFRKP
jgi:hypothetical protein